MVLKRLAPACLAVLLMLGALRVGAQCAEDVHTDFGYAYIVSDSGFAMFRANGREYVRFLSNPVVHNTRGEPGGFRDNDTITAINGEEATSRAAAVMLADARSAVRFEVSRGGVTLHLTVTPSLACRQSAAQTPSWLGFALSCADCEAILLSSGEKGWRFRRHPVVSRVDRASAAARAGLRVGDVLHEINGHVSLTPEAAAALARARPGERFTLAVKRNESIVRIQFIADAIGRDR